MPQKSGKKRGTTSSDADSHYHTHKTNRNKGGRVSRDALYWVKSPFKLAIWLVRLFVSTPKTVTEEELAYAMSVIRSGKDYDGGMQKIADRYAQQAVDYVDTYHAYRDLGDND